MRAHETLVKQPPGAIIVLHEAFDTDHADCFTNWGNSSTNALKVLVVLC